MTKQVKIRLLCNCKSWKDDGVSYPVEVMAVQAGDSGNVIGYVVSDEALKEVGVFNELGAPRCFTPEQCEALE